MQTFDKDLREIVEILREKGLKLRAISDSSGVGYYKLKNVLSRRSKGSVDDLKKIIMAFPEYLSDDSDNSYKKKYRDALERLDNLRLKNEEIIKAIKLLLSKHEGELSDEVKEALEECLREGDFTL